MIPFRNKRKPDIKLVNTPETNTLNDTMILFSVIPINIPPSSSVPYTPIGSPFAIFSRVISI